MKAIQYVNNLILKQASSLKYIVKNEAPSTELELFNSPTLIVWSGASDNTIYQDNNVNYAFRALYDVLHLETKLNFSVDAEIELGRIQASKYDSDIMQELVYCEVAMQAMHYKTTGQFVSDQIAFTKTYMAKKGYNL